MGRWGLRFAGRRAYMTDHAIERWRQRVRPHLDSDEQAHADAVRLVSAVGEFSETPPAWVNGNWARELETEGRGWLVLGDICMPLAEDREKPGRLVALTVLTRGGISDESRKVRNRMRSHRTYAKRKRNKMDSRLTRGTNRRVEPDPDV